MLRKIVTKLKLGSCKTKILHDVNEIKESEKKKIEDSE